MKTFTVSIECSWIEEVKADSEEAALKKTYEKYRKGKGRFPREYVDVSIEHINWCEIE